MSKIDFIIKLKDLILTKEIFASIVGGITAGIIGFLSASLVNYFRNKHEIRDQRDNAVIMLYREITENRFVLEEQLKKNTVRKRKLPTVIWDTKKYIVDFDKPFLMEGMSLIYDKIASYNEMDPGDMSIYVTSL